MPVQLVAGLVSPLVLPAQHVGVAEQHHQRRVDVLDAAGHHVGHVVNEPGGVGQRGRLLVDQLGKDQQHLVAQRFPEADVVLEKQHDGRLEQHMALLVAQAVQLVQAGPALGPDRAEQGQRRVKLKSLPVAAVYTGVQLDRGQQTPVRHRPEPDRVIPADRCQQPFVGREGNGDDPVRMGLQLGDNQAGFRFDDTDGTTGGHRDHFPAGRPGDRSLRLALDSHVHPGRSSGQAKNGHLVLHADVGESIGGRRPSPRPGAAAANRELDDILRRRIPGVRRDPVDAAPALIVINAQQPPVRGPGKRGQLGIDPGLDESSRPAVPESDLPGYRPRQPPCSGPPAQHQVVSERHPAERLDVKPVARSAQCPRDGSVANSYREQASVSPTLLNVRATARGSC